MSVTFVVVSVVLLCFRPIFPFSSFQPFLFIGGFDSSALCRSRRELSDEYLLAKIGVDTAENEPLEVWGKIQIHYSLHSLVFRNAAAPRRHAGLQSVIFGPTLAARFSALSTKDSE